MMNTTNLFGLMVVLGLCLAAFPAWTAAPKTVTITDRIGVNWEEELVHYRLEFARGDLTGVAAAKVGIAGGEDVLCQVSDVARQDDGSIRSFNVWFLADVPANEAVSYTITPGAQGPQNAGVWVKSTAESIELTTKAPETMGIRLLGGTKEYNWPVPAQQVPGPIQGFLLPSGRETGKGRFEVPFLVKSYEAEVTAAGPLFAEARIHYVFDTGYWTFKARVLKDCPMIVIEEEFDNGFEEKEWDKADRFYSVVLNAGAFKPAEAFYAGRSDEPQYCNLLKKHMPEQLKGLRASDLSYVSGYSLSFKDERDDYFLNPFPTWSARAGVMIRFVEPGEDAVGFTAVRSAVWRNPLAIRFHVNTRGELLARFPLQVYKQGWPSEGFGYHSPNATGKALFVPDSTSRRHYGIMLSRAKDERKNAINDLFQTAAHLGAQTLDEVKDWILDWPDPMKGAQWADQTSEAGKKAIQTVRNWINMKRSLGNLGKYSMWVHRALTHGRYGVIAPVINSSKDLTAEDRKTLRSICAFQAYVHNSVESFPWGVGCHLGNPNMSIMAVNARVKSSLLVKDHPMFKTWGAWTLEFMKDYIRRFTRQSGAPYECPHYTLGVTLTELAESNQALMDSGIGDAFDTELFKRCMRFTFNWLLPPDLRFNGHRTIMPIGNTSYQSVPPHLAELLVNYYKERDPEFAGKIQWFANQTLADDKRLHIVEDKVPELGSAHYEDYGVFFRHGFGTPYETYFHMMAGNCLGHYEASDHMCYTLYAKGQPINLHFGNGYFPMFGREWLRNSVSIDHRRSGSYERKYAKTLAAAFTGPAEYARASLAFDRLQAPATEYPPPYGKGKDPWPTLPYEDIPLTTWYRQVLFVKDEDPKGPNYFILRDTFAGTPTKPTDLSLWFLAKGMERRGDVFHYNGQLPVDMDVFVNTPVDFKPETGKFGHIQQPYGRLTGDDLTYYPGGKRAETQLFLRIKQPAGKGYFVVLYPRLKEGDPEAKFTRLAESAVKVETALSTDYAFLNSHPFTFKGEQVQFEGMAAAVRFYKSGKIAVANCEGKAQMRLAGRTICGEGAFVVTVEDGEVSSETYEDHARVEVR